MVFNTSSAAIIDQALDQELHYSVLRHVLNAGVGIFCGFLCYKLGYQRLIDNSPFILFILCLLLFVPFLPVIGVARNGAHRWIGLGSLTFQPSELVKYFLPAFFIHYVLEAKQELDFRRYVKLLAILALPAFLVVIEPDHGTTMIMGVSIISLMFLMKIPLRFWAWPLAILTALAVVAGTQVPYVKGRLQVYLNPELDIQGKGHQPFQAKIASGTGGLTGKGLGKSIQKLSYLPEAKNDFIAAIYAEEFGYLGVVGLMLLYLMFAMLGFWIAFETTDLRAFCLGSAITFLIFFQVFLNLGVVSGLLPNTGLNLPFFSQGGTSLIVNICALFVLLNIDAQSALPEKKAKNKIVLN